MDHAALGEVEVVLQRLVAALRNVDLPRHAARFKPRGEVHGGTPQIVAELLAANHAGHHGAAVDADADGAFGADLAIDDGDGLQQLERHLGDRDGMIVPGDGQAADHHVAVADGFDFLETVALDQAVEGSENLIEHGHQFARVRAAGELREPHQIGEHHGDRRVIIRDGSLATLEPVGDGARENVQQQTLGLFLFKLEQLLLALQFLQPHAVQVAQAFFLQRRHHARAQQHGIERLGQIILRADLDALHRVVKLLRTRDDDDRHRARERVALDGVEHLQAVQLGHLHVEQHEVKFPRANQVQRLTSVGGLGDVPHADLVERADKQAAQRAAVINHQHHGGLRGILHGRLGRRRGAVRSATAPDHEHCVAFVVVAHARVRK